MDPFVGEWTINSWMPDPKIVLEGIPMDAFQVGGSLDISPDPAASSDTFRLEWHDQNGDSRFASGLHPALDLEQSKLTGQNRPVNFGAGEVECTFILTLIRTTDPKELKCVINVADPVHGSLTPDTGSGTFTATANGGN